MDCVTRWLRTRSAASALALALVSAPGFAPGIAPAGVSASPPNVVLFLVDDLGWTDWQRSPDLNPTGSLIYETPHLESLARRGVVFDDAYSAAPVCSPSRAAIMTGMAPARLHLTDFVVGSGNHTESIREPTWSNNLSPDAVTLADAFAAAGYDTGFFGKWHLGPSGESGADPLRHGFATNVAGSRLGSPTLAGGFTAGSDGAWRFMPGLTEHGSFAPDTFLTDVLALRAERFVASRTAAGTPFLAVVSLYAVHPTYEAPPDLVEKYRRKIDAKSSGGLESVDHGHAIYAAMIEKVDDALGRLLARLDDPNGDGDTSDGIRDATIVVFASDNGGLLAAPEPATSNAPLRSGKGSLYEGGIRVPFIVSFTGHPRMPDGTGTRGRRTAARTSSQDIFATLLDLTGVGDATERADWQTLDGVSLRSALEGGDFDRGDQFWHYPHRSPQAQSDPDFAGGSFVSAVRRGRWKLLYFWETRSFELYDLVADIGESRDLAASRPEVVHELTDALSRWLVATGAQLPVERATDEPLAYPLAPATRSTRIWGLLFVSVLLLATWLSAGRAFRAKIR